MPAPQKIKLYYDPLGNVIRTVNPDNTEQWVVHGKPDSLGSVEVNNHWSFKGYTPSPWESYTYDANDLAVKTGHSFTAHAHTPASAVIDPLGRPVKSIARLGTTTADEVITQQCYDIQGNVLEVKDALGRIVFKHKYGIGKQLLWKKHIDSGVSTLIADATGKPITAIDARGAQVLTAYDALSRPIKVWAKEQPTDSYTLRQESKYAENELGMTAAKDKNIVGQIYQHYDEAGLNQIEQCDYKGNPLEKVKQNISDATLLAQGTTSFTVDWTSNPSILDATEYRTTIEYDAMNRGTKLTLPKDINNHRAVIEPVFNNAGALERIKKDNVEYVKHIAYDAKGQQLLAAWNNDIMMRFAYDEKTFRLKRVKAEKYSRTGNTFTHQSGTSRYDQTYIYDLVGNILAVNDTTPDCGIQNSTDTLQRLFEYDALYRLLKGTGREMNAQGEGFLFADAPTIGSPTANDCRYYAQEYAYDKIGNIQTLKHRVINNSSLNYTRKFVYNSANNQHTQINNNQTTPTVYSTFAYDAVGNMISSNADREYRWNAASQLIFFGVQASGSYSKYAHYLYDAGGSRTKKVVINQNGDYESVTYIDGVFELRKRVAGGTTEQKNYIQLLGGVEERIGSYSDDITDAVIYQIADHLGSGAIRLNSTGGIIDREEYYPYGDSSLRTFSSKRFRYIGKEKDEESGLYQMGARYYAPWTCKFLSVDPLAGKYAHQSSYCYADCNPLMKNDPSGMGAGGVGDKDLNDGGGSSGSVTSGSVTSVKPTDPKTDPKNTPPSIPKPIPLPTKPEPRDGQLAPTPRIDNLKSVPQKSELQTISEELHQKNTPVFNQDNRSETQKKYETNAGERAEWEKKQMETRQALDPIMYGGGDLGYGASKGTGDAVVGALFISNPELAIATGGFNIYKGYQNDNAVQMLGGGFMLTTGTFSFVRNLNSVNINLNNLAIQEGEFLGFNTTIAAKGGTGPTGKFYSVAFETELASTSYPGVSRYMHFQEANVALDAAMKTNPMLGQLGISVPRSTAGSIIGKSPTNWVWNHNVNKGVMQLVPKAQHPNIPGGIFWETMHPGGVGGYSIWGK